MDSLTDVIQQIKSRRVAIGRVDETFVCPVLASLGWNVSKQQRMLLTSAETQTEYLALYDQSRLCVLIDTAPLCQKLAGRAAQLLHHAAKERACVAVVTNGVEWWFYLPKAEKWSPVPLKTVDLMSRNEPNVRKVLKDLLSPTSIHLRPRPIHRQEYPVSPIAEMTSRGPEACAPGGAVCRGQSVSGLCPPPYSVPVAVVLDGERLSVRHWNELLIVTAEWLLRKGSTLPYDKKVKRSRWILVSYDLHNIKQRPHRLSNGAYLEICYSGTDCVYWAQWLMHQAGFGGPRFSTEYREP